MPDPVYSALDLWEYGHEILPLVRKIESCLQSLGRDEDIGFEYDVPPREALNDAIVHLDRLLKRRFTVPDDFREPEQEEQEGIAGAPPEDIPF